LMKHVWIARVIRGNTYAFTSINGKEVKMHHFLLHPQPGFITVHLDRNGLNNCKDNLRNATQQQATWTRKPIAVLGGKPVSSQYKGVRKIAGSTFTAGIRKDGMPHDLGVYVDEVSAARAYDRMARRLFKEFAYLNFPEEE